MSVNIKLKNSSGVETTYSGVDTINVPLADSGTQDFKLVSGTKSVAKKVAFKEDVTNYEYVTNLPNAIAQIADSEEEPYIDISETDTLSSAFSSYYDENPFFNMVLNTCILRLNLTELPSTYRNSLPYNNIYMPFTKYDSTDGLIFDYVSVDISSSTISQIGVHATMSISYSNSQQNLSLTSVSVDLGAGAIPLPVSDISWTLHKVTNSAVNSISSNQFNIEVTSSGQTFTQMLPMLGATTWTGIAGVYESLLELRTLEIMSGMVIMINVDMSSGTVSTYLVTTDGTTPVSPSDTVVAGTTYIGVSTS